MRIPLSKIYRAFPELDPFPDSECERFVLSARTQSGATIGAASFFAFCFSLMVYAIFVWFIAAWASRFIKQLFQGSLAVDQLEMLSTGLVLVCGPLFACLCFGLTRDTFLRRAILDRINLARCTACKFSLLGLPVVLGQVRCPECGGVINLASIGLRPTDLLTPSERSKLSEQAEASDVGSPTARAANWFEEPIELAPEPQSPATPEPSQQKTLPES